MKRGRRKKINGIFTPLTRVMQSSDAWQALSCRDVYIWTEMMRKYKGEKPDPEDEKFTFIPGDIPKGKMGRKQFYESRNRLVELGFFDVDEGDEGAFHRKRTKFRISEKWKSISQIMREERLKKEHSKKMKERFKHFDLAFKKEDKKS